MTGRSGADLACSGGEATGNALGGADLEARGSAPLEAGRRRAAGGTLAGPVVCLKWSFFSNLQDRFDLSAGEKTLKRFPLTSGKRG